MTGQRQKAVLFKGMDKRKFVPDSMQRLLLHGHIKNNNNNFKLQDCNKDPHGEVYV